MTGKSLASLAAGVFSIALFAACASRPVNAPPQPPPPNAPPAPAVVPPPPATPPPAPPPPAMASDSVPQESEPAASPPAGISSASAREILRLRQAGYSEDFLLNKVRHDDENFHLSTDDLISLRQAGLSETLIDAMVRSGGGGFSSPAPAPAARHAEFDGIVHQKHGFLGIGGSKTKGIGKLVVDNDRVNWYQGNDPEENFSLYQKNIKEMWLNCAPRAGENLCLELCLKTYAGDEWCFRDAGWSNGENRQVTAIFDYFQKAFPATFFSQREKKSF
jgi:hypothetical protein